MGGTKDHSASDASNAGEFTRGAGSDSDTPGPTMAAQAQQKAGELRDTAQEKAQGIKEQAQSKVFDVKEQAQTALTDAKEHASQSMDDAKSQVQDKIDAVTTQAQDTIESVRANLQTKSDQLRETVTGKTDQFKGTVGEKGEQVKQAANEKSTQAGEKLTGLAGALREKTETMGAESPVANVATKAAGALEQTGSYLQEHTPDDWVGDLKQLISRKPLESVLVAAGIGYMAARAFRK